MSRKPTYEELEQKIQDLMAVEAKRKGTGIAFERLFDLSIDMLCVVDIDGYFKVINEAFQKLLGYTKEELYAKPFIHFVHPDDKATTMDVVEQLYRGKPVTYFENRYRCKDGSYKLLDWTSMQVEQGFVYAAARDLTDKKQTQEALQKAHNELESKVAQRTNELKKSNERLRKEIKERERAEEAQKKNEAQLLSQRDFLRSAIDALTHPFYVIDPTNYEIILANSAANMGDLSERPTCHGRTHGQIKPCSGDEHPCPLKEVMRTRKPVTVEHVHSDKDSGNHHVEIHAYPVFDDGGNIFQVIEYCLDITDRKQTENALKVSEERYRALFQHSPVDTIIVDYDGKITEYNSSRRLAGGRLPNIGDVMYKDYASKHEIDMYKDLMECIRSGESKKYPELKYKERYLNIIISPFPGGAIIVSSDLTDRKIADKALLESEERYRRITEAVTDYVYAVHLKDGHPVETVHSPTCFAVTGYRPEDFASDPQLWLRMVHEEDRDVVQTQAKQVLLGQEFQPIEHRILRKDGTMRWVRNTVVPHYDSQDKLLSYDGLIRDVTERKQAEEEKAKLQNQILQSQKMKAVGSLAGGIAHQFNNALAGITGYLDMLEMDFPDNEIISNYTKRMTDSVFRMTQLTNQLLAYARGGRYQAKTIPLSNFIMNTLPLLTHTISSSIHIDTDLPHDIFSIKADLTQMQFVLSAILTNASEAIEGKGRIQIICRNELIVDNTVEELPTLKPGAYVKLTIADDGNGMDEEIASRIFEPFFTTKFQGRGLEMAAVYGIVKNHDGWILVDSELGKGTTVHIYFPAVEVTVEGHEKPKATTVKGTGTIMLVEDEEIVMNVNRALLERLGYRVLAAKTGKEAIDMAQTFDGDIDLVILDIVLPDMEGRAVYPLIMKARPNLRVIVCSGYSIDGPAQEILEAGAQDFIQKPFTLKDLSEKLRKVFKRGNNQVPL